MRTNLSQVSGALADINKGMGDSAVTHMGIRFVAAGRDFLMAEMPVDERTRQPFDILHGGASILLAETLGSLASTLLVHGEGARVAGIEVNGSHLRPARSGWVTGVCRPLRIGRSLHSWHIEVRNEDHRLCCDARLTVKILRPLAGSDDG